MERVHYGRGALGELPAELQRLQVSKSLVLTTRSLRDSSALASVLDHAASSTEITVGPNVASHLPFECVDEILSTAHSLEPDAVVTIGGGSVTDAGKAVAAALATGCKTAEDLGALDWTTGGRQYRPHIAIPTTLSAAEYNGAFAMSRRGVKDGYLDIRLTPRVVILDSDVVRETPDELWGTTGIRALDHAFETYVSSAPTAPTDATAVHAAKMLFRRLSAGLGPNADPDARLDCLVAAWLSFFGVHNAMVGLSHGLGHQIGARLGAPHGLTSCITLPHVIAFLGQRMPQRVADFSRDVGISDPGASDVRAVEQLRAKTVELVRLVGGERTLSSLGATEADLGQLASAALDHTTARFAPVPVGRDDVMMLLRAAM